MAIVPKILHKIIKNKLHICMKEIINILIKIKDINNIVKILITQRIKKLRLKYTILQEEKLISLLDDNQ